MCAKRNFEPVQKRFWTNLARKKRGFTNFSALGVKVGKGEFAGFDKSIILTQKN